MDGIVEKIFISSAGGADMKAVEEVEAEAGCGLRGDRYSKKSGYWTGVDECEVTLIESEDLDQIRLQTDGQQALVEIDGSITLLSHTFGDVLNDGSLGLGASESDVRFDNLSIDATSADVAPRPS